MNEAATLAVEAIQGANGATAGNFNPDLLAVDNTLPTQAPSPFDVAKLQAAMSAPPVGATTELGGVRSISGAEINADTINIAPGDDILGNLDAARTGTSSTGLLVQKAGEYVNSMRERYQNIHQLLARTNGRPDYNTTELITMQVSCTLYALSLDLFSKSAQKISEGVQTLFRNQG